MSPTTKAHGLWTVSVDTTALFLRVSTFLATESQISNLHQQNQSANSRLHHLPPEILNLIDTLLQSSTADELSAGWPDRLARTSQGFSVVSWMNKAEIQGLRSLERDRRIRVQEQDALRRNERRYRSALDLYSKRAKGRYQEAYQQVMDSLGRMGSEIVIKQCLKAFSVRPLFILRFQHGKPSGAGGEKSSFDIFAYLAIPVSKPVSGKHLMDIYHYLDGNSMRKIDCAHPLRQMREKAKCQKFVRALEDMELNVVSDHLLTIANAGQEGESVICERPDLTATLRVIGGLKEQS